MTAWRFPLARGGLLESDRCLVMGVLNATPDSFSDGGLLSSPEAVHRRVQGMLADGADILDVGGESTRPGHEPVSSEEELRRVLPVIRAIREVARDAVVSVDTRKADVARVALDAGADLVNDVGGLQDAALAETVRRHGCTIIGMRGHDCAGDIVEACRDQLTAVRDRAVAAGIPQRALVLDPGLGFGARPGPHVADNLALIDALGTLSLGQAMLVGASRKRFVGALTGERDTARRDAASARLAVRAACAGAAMVRVHDVAGTVAALRAAGL